MGNGNGKNVIQSQVTSHKSQVTSHKSQVTSHKSQVTSHKSQVTSHKSQVTSLLAHTASWGEEVSKFTYLHDFLWRLWLMDGHGQRSGKGMVRRLAVLLGSAALLLPMAEPVGQRSGIVARYLLAVAATAMATPVQAQTVTTLVSNTGQTQTGLGSFGTFDAAQSFTAGNNDNGYKLTAVDISLDIILSGTCSSVLAEYSDYSVAIWGSTSDGLPDSSNILGTLTNPTLSGGDNVFTFNAPGNGLDLDASTTYFVVIDVNTVLSACTINVTNASSNSEDPGNASGWSIGDNGHYRSRTSTGGWTSFDQSRRIAIKGYANSGGTTTTPNAAPTVVNQIADQTATVGTAFSFPFPATTFNDADGDTLTYTVKQVLNGDETDLSGWLSFNATTRTFSGTPQASDIGTITVKLTASDGTASVSDEFDIVVSAAPDTEAPTVVSIVRSSPTTSPTNENELVWLVQFSEVVENVDAADFTVSGTSATVSGITDLETEPGVLYLVTVSGGDLDDYDGTVTLGFASGQNIQDEAGNTLSATTPTGTDESSYVLDNTAPTVSITVPDTTATGEVTITISFSEEVNGFTQSDITVSSDRSDFTLSDFTVTTPGQVWTLKVTTTVENDEMTVNIPAGVAQDEAGNDNTAAAPVTTTYRIPNTPPTAANSTVTVTEDGDWHFGPIDLNYNDADGETMSSGLIISLPAPGKGELRNYETPLTASDLPARLFFDGDLGYFPPANANGDDFTTFKFKVNDGEDDSTAEYTMTIDITAVNDAPTVASGIADQTVAVGATLSLTIPDDAFDDVEDDSLTYDVELFESSDTGPLPSWLTFTTDTFEATPAASNIGTITVQVTAKDSDNATVNDRFDIVVEAAPDTEPPTVASIRRSSPTTSLTNANELVWMVQFSEVVENVDAADFTVSGTSATVSGITDSETEPGVLYLVTVSGGDLDDYDGPVTLGFASGQNIQDEAGNTLSVTTPGTNENSYEMDNTAPTVSITAPETTATAEFTITISFSEEVNGFVENDIMVSTTSGDYGTSFTAITPGQEWRFGMTLAVDNEVATISIPAGVAQDDAGNDNSAAQQVTTTYTIPNTPPTSQNSTVTVTEDTRYTFSSSEFSFTDDDNDSFSRVIITSLPAAGKGNLNALESGNVVAASDLPYSFTPADIDDDSFGYTPPANANGDNFATFKFKVNDGEDDSTAEYTMTINITAVNDAPTVASGIADQTVAVGGTLSLTIPDDAFEDVEDDDSLTYEALLWQSGDTGSLPNWISFTTATGAFEITPGAGNTGTTMVQVTATDSDSASVSTRFEIEVVAAADPRVIVTPPASSSVAEGSGTASYTVELNTQPSGPVTISASSSDSGALAASPASLTFTTSDWDTAQTVTLSGVEDDNAIDETVTISHSVSGYGSISVGAVVTISVTDNDTAGVSVSTASASLNEGEASTYTVTLDSQPGGNVTISASSSDSGALTVSPASLTFTTSNWDTAQPVTVTGVDDADTDNETVTVSHGVSGYGSVTADSVTVTVTDAGDTTAPTVTITGVPSTSDKPFTATISFSEMVDGFVESDIMVSDNARLSAFRATTTDTVWEVVVTPTASGTVTLDIGAAVATDGANNDNTAATQVSSTYTAPAPPPGREIWSGRLTVQELNSLQSGCVNSGSSNRCDDSSILTDDDFEFNGVTYSVDAIRSASVGLNFRMTPVFSGESGIDAAALQAALALTVDGQPVSSILLTPGSGESTISKVLSIPWSAGQEVEIKLFYNDTTPPTVSSITRQTPTTSPTNEDSLTWRVAFSETVKDVDSGDFEVSGTSATLSVAAVTGENYTYDVTASGGNLASLDGTVTLSVAAGQDIKDEGDNTLNITPPGTNEDTYVLDNTAPSITYTAPDSLMVGTTVTIIPTDITDASEIVDFSATTLPPGLTIAQLSGDISGTPTTATTSTTTVTVTATDEVGNEGTTTLVFPMVAAAVAPGVSITPPADLSITEGGTLTYTVKPDTDPGSGSTVTISTSVSGDSGAVSLSTTSLTFTTANWETAQMVTVTAVDDDVDNEDETVTISHGVSGYGAVSVAAAVTVTVTDDDIAGVTVTPASVTLDEGGTTTYTVTLDTQPTGNVTITPSNSDSGAVSLSPASITFTTTNWDTAQPVSVTAVEDENTDDETVSISHSVSGYGSVTADSVTVMVTDAGDTTAPQVSSISLQTPTAPGYAFVTNADSLIWRVTFSEDVRNVDGTDFTVTANGGSGITVTVEPVSGQSRAYDVTASGGNLATLNGVSVKLVFVSGQNIEDLAGNALANTTPTGVNEFYLLDNDAPTVNFIRRDDPSNPRTNANTLSWHVQLFDSRGVKTNSVDKDDFMVTGGSTATVTSFRSSGEGNFTVVISGGDLEDYNGEVGLGFASGQDIEDVIGNPLTNTTPTTGDNEVYELDNTVTVGYTVPETLFLSIGTAIVPIMPTTADTDIESYSATALPAGLTIDGSSGEISGTPTTASNPSEAMVTVTDDLGNSVVVPLTFPAVVEPGVSVDPASLPPVEGQTLPYSVVLDTPPSGPVTITTSNSDSGAVSLSPTSLTFTTANWDTAQTVSVTAVDDTDTNSETVTVSHSVSGYGSVTAADAVTISVTDDDAPGVNVQPTSDDLSEGQTLTYTVRLITQPSGPVTITSSSSGDSGAVSISPTSLTFTPSDWSARMVTVTAADDDVDTDNQSVTISHSVSGYGAITVADPVTVTVTDNDTAGVNVMPPASGDLSEGETRTYTLQLNTEPGGPVTITASSSDSAALTISPASLTFTPSDWDTPRTVTVTAVDDDVDTGNRSATISHSISGYGAITVADAVTVTVADDDTAGVTVTPPASGDLNEGGTLTYTVTLNTQPSSPVTINPGSSDSAALTISPASLTFTPSDWDTPRTVSATAVDDDVDTGNRSVTISHSVSGYGAITVADAVTVTVADDDTTGVNVTPPASGDLNEGGTLTYTVTLNTQPGGTVTITPGSSDSAALTISPASLIFTPSDWDTPRTVSVMAVDDDVDTGNRSVTISHSVSGYGAITVADAVTVTVADDDAAGVNVTPPASGDLNEGGTLTYAVTLNTQPGGPVTITPGSSDSAALTISPASLIFTPSDWDTPRTVSVMAVDDDVDTGNRSVTISHSVSGYGAITIADAVTVTVADDDAAGVNVSLTSEDLNEGGTLTYTVTLNTQPSSPVTIAASSSDSAALTVSPASLIFTPSDWDTRTVTVTAADDDVDTGNQTVTISHSVSGDGSTITIADVTVTVADDDAAGVNVSLTSEDLNEGETRTYTVTLNTQPSGPVTITPSSSDSDAVSVSPASLIFTPSDWDTPRTVTVTAADDDVDTGNQTVTISHSVSGDGATITIADVTVTVAEDDAAGVNVSLTSEDLNEGETRTYTVTLNTQPSGSVTITPSITGDSEAVSVSPASLIFTPSDWDTQTVTVTAADDDVDTGNQTVTISHSVSGYGAITVADAVTVTVTEDDATMPTVNIAGPSSATVSEGDALAFTLTLDQTVATDLTVDLTITETGEMVSAEGGSLQVTVSQGQSQAVFTVATDDDETDETDSVVTVTVVGDSATPATYQVGSVPEAVVTVADNDDAAPETDDRETVVDEEEPLADTMAPTVTYTAPPSLTVGTAITLNPTTEDVDITSYDATGLPAGLTIDSNTGVISGTPTTASDSSAIVTVTVMDTTGNRTEVTLTFPVVVTEDVRQEQVAREEAQEEAQVVLDEVVVPNVVQQLTAETTEVITSRLTTITAGPPPIPPSPPIIPSPPIAPSPPVAPSVPTAPSPTAPSPSPDTSTISLNDLLTDTLVALYGQRERLKDGSMEWQQALAGRSFVLPPPLLHLAQGEGVSAQDHPFSTLAIWGGADYSSYDNIIEDTDVGGDGFSATIGADLQPIPRLVTGLALTTSRWGLDYATDDATATGTYHVGITVLNPYLSWSATDQLSLWATVGYGRGQVEHNPEGQDAPPPRTDVLTSWAGGLRFEVVPGGNPHTGQGAPFGLAIKGDGAASSFLDSQVQLARLAAEVSRSFTLENGLLSAAVELGWSIRTISSFSDDTLDAQQQAIAEQNHSGGGAELAGNLNWRHADGSLSATLDTRVLLGGGHHREWGIGGYLRLTPSRRDGEGLSLTLHPSFGVTGTKLDDLWSLSGNSNLVTSNDQPGVRLDAQLAYGFPLGNATLTPYTELTWAETTNTYGAGLRYHLIPFLQLDLKGARRNNTDGNREHRFSLDVRSHR